MRYLIPCVLCVQAFFCVQTSGITDSMYHILSSKIDTMNLEMVLMRDEQLQTKQELRQAKAEIEKLKEHQSQDVPNTTAGEGLSDAQVNESKSRVMNFLQKAFQSEKAHTKQTLDQMKTDVALIRSHLNTLVASVETLNETQVNLLSEVFKVGRDVEHDMKKLNDALVRMHPRLEWLDTSFSSLNVTQRQTVNRVILLDKEVNFLKSSLVNVNTALEQQLTNLIETVSEMNTSLKEKCQSGEFGPHLFNPAPSYPVTLTINFLPAFKSKPAIVYGLKVLDSAHNTNVRVSGTIAEMTNAYFKFTISTWASTVMYGAKFSWMACPKTNI
ncbi:hypothetical protein MAR_026968 [Mya arenaria]|uniref:H-type lectin domain-containing protein n=1 Tax=Mya arenaria TaxID=6604 RepID=A0ABY7EW84_MYAAR|nr:uncharacterized protein LOC128242621 [Mya arenaria]WAR12788.1 hypothetical protein MAR_026968 [Mya arenaria]